MSEDDWWVNLRRFLPHCGAKDCIGHSNNHWTCETDPPELHRESVW